jgi:hypothetical protein
MKKIIGLVSVVAVMFTLAYAGENYFHTIKAEIGGFATGLGVGMSEPAAGYVLDVSGANRITGVTTMVGSPVITGSPAVTGSPTVVGSITISSSATTAYDCTDYGAVAALSTHSVVACSKAFLSTDATLYVATTTVGENSALCASGTCWKGVW